MTKPRRKYVGFWIVVAVLFLSTVGALGYIAYEIYQTSPSAQLDSSFKSLSCKDEAVDEGVMKNCKLNFTLTNNSDEVVLPDINGINGPGFAESGVHRVHIKEISGTTFSVFVGDEDADKISPHKTVDITASFSIQKKIQIVEVSIFGKQYPIEN